MVFVWNGMGLRRRDDWLVLEGGCWLGGWLVGWLEVLGAGALCSFTRSLSVGWGGVVVDACFDGLL